VSRTITYTINKKHDFNLLVSAEVEAAVLELSKSSLNFAFEDDLLDESTSQTIMITNKSN